MNKERIKLAMVEHQIEVIDNLKNMIKRLNEDADIDENNVRDKEDLSHQDESKDSAQALLLQLTKAEQDLNVLKETDIQPCDKVKLGALVVTDQYCFFISVATHPFMLEGKKYIGMATDAPVYPLIKDKKVGETYSFAKKQHLIKEIY